MRATIEEVANPGEQRGPSQTSVAKGNPGRLWERVYAKVEPLCGPFNVKDIVHVYNCALKMPAKLGDFVAKFHSYFVNPAIRTAVETGPLWPCRQAA